MTRLFARLAYEAKGLNGVFDLSTRCAFAGAILHNLPSILRTRKLTAADSGVEHTVSIRYRGTRFTFPLAEINRQTRAHEPTSAFGALREMYGHDVYLRHFTRTPVARTVLDLGANRGFFAPIAAKTLGAATVIAIDPVTYYPPVALRLLTANGIDPATVHRHVAFCGPEDGPGVVSIGEAMRQARIDHIDFCKMDIEGGEFALFAADALLPNIDMLAAELHPDQGDLDIIEQGLARHGFTRRYSNQFGERVGHVRADYVCAARDPSLIRLD